MKRKNTIKQLLMYGLCLLSLHQVLAQQDAQYTQYMYNPASLNPAYAGSVSNLQIFGLYRTQWVGLEGAPKTAYISATTPISDNGISMGFHFRNESIGIMDENNLSIDVAYSIELNHQYRLAFGLKGSGSFLDVNYDKLHIYDGSDPVSGNNISNKFSGNIGAGAFLYSEKAYVGLSAPMLVSSNIYNDNDYKVMKEKTHFYMTGGYVFDINYKLQFKPAVLVKVATGTPLQVDLTANFLLYDKFTLGAAYRWDSSVSALVGFQVSKGLFVGYTYDADTSKLSKYNSGSHEIFMKFELFSNNRRKVAPRFF